MFHALQSTILSVRCKYAAQGVTCRGAEERVAANTVRVGRWRLQAKVKRMHVLAADGDTQRGHKRIVPMTPCSSRCSGRGPFYVFKSGANIVIPLMLKRVHV